MERPESEMRGWSYDDDDEIIEVSRKKIEQDQEQSFTIGYTVGGITALVLALLVGMAVGYS